jgi:hypothetical protein
VLSICAHLSATSLTGTVTVLPLTALGGACEGGLRCSLKSCYSAPELCRPHHGSRQAPALLCLAPESHLGSAGETPFPRRKRRSQSCARCLQCQVKLVTSLHSSCSSGHIVPMMAIYSALRIICTCIRTAHDMHIQKVLQPLYSKMYGMSTP